MLSILGEQVRGVHLRESHAVLVHLAAEQHGVFVERDVRLVAQAVNPAHAVNEAALDVVDVVAPGPFETFLEGPIGGVEGVGVEADFSSSARGAGCEV
jgi:hypothetical protein